MRRHPLPRARRVRLTFRTRLFNSIVWLAVLSALAATAAITFPGTVDAQSSGEISGSVVNGTTQEPAAEIEVALSRFTADGFQEETRTLADEDGLFSFSGLDTDPANVYAVSIDYLNVLYSSGMLRFSEGVTDLTVEVAIYETTTSTESLRIQSKGLILSVVDTEAGETGLLDVAVLQLDGDLSLVPNDNGRTVAFPVPRDAREVTPVDGFNFGNPTIEGATVYSTAPLTPGSHSSSLAYAVPYTGSTLRLELDIAYPTDAVNILVPDTADLGTISVDGAGIVDEGRSQIGDQTYRVWSAPPMNSGSTLNLTFRMLPESSVSANTLSRLEPILISLFAIGVAIAVVGFIVYRRKLYRRRPTVFDPVIASSVQSRRELLIEELRTLEAARAEDNLDEEDYLQYRATILEQLRQISRHMRELDDTGV